jgi:ureidoacrylate peracid hydrolase
MTHEVEIRPEVKERVRQRRGRLHFYDRLDPRRTAQIVIDMQNVFVAPGAPIEVPAARGIVERINETNRALRALGVRIVWVTHRNLRHGDGNDWALYYDHVMTPEGAREALDWFQPEHAGSRIWSGLEVRPEDAQIVKCRYSALIQGSSGLERYLRSNGIENLLISGTKTNVCCESTARDAMMLDFRTVMLSDCTAAQSDEEHRATLENMIRNFADVMTGAQALSVLAGNPLNE